MGVDGCLALAICWPCRCLSDAVTLASTANNSDPDGAPPLLLLLLLLLFVDGLLERLQYGLVKMSDELSSPPLLSSLVMLATGGGGGGWVCLCLCLCLLYTSCWPCTTATVLVSRNIILCNALKGGVVKYSTTRRPLWDVSLHIKSFSLDFVSLWAEPIWGPDYRVSQLCPRHAQKPPLFERAVRDGVLKGYKNDSQPRTSPSILRRRAFHFVSNLLIFYY